MSAQCRARGPRGSRQKLHLRRGLGPGPLSQSQVFQEPHLNHRSPLRASRRKHISAHLEQSFPGTSLVVQWLKSAFLVQGAWVQSLVRELRLHMANKQDRKSVV